MTVEQLTLVDVAYYVELDQQVDKAEGDGIWARWQFGRTALSERVGKQLPKGRITEIANAIGKSETEVKYRMRFAERHPTEAEVGNAIADFGSWYAIVNGALASTAHLSAKKDEWATPDELFKQLDDEFGFTVDVCAAPGNAKCERFWAKADDGLAQDWTGETCWMNPPYSELEKWIAKAAEAGRNGVNVVCLVPSRTDVAWFWDYARYGQIRFLRGRQWFVDDEGNTGPAPFPSVVVVFGPDNDSGVMWYET